MKKTNIFSEVQNVRNSVMEKVLTNQKLLKLIAIQNPKALELPDIKDTATLIGTNLYFKPRILEQTVGGVKNFLLTDFSVIATYEQITYLDIRLNFRVFVHNKLYELDNGDARIYAIAEELANLFDEAKGTWIGKCHLTGCYDLEVPTEYQGIEMSFSITGYR